MDVKRIYLCYNDIANGEITMKDDQVKRYFLTKNNQEVFNIIDKKKLVIKKIIYILFYVGWGIFLVSLFVAKCFSSTILYDIGLSIVLTTALSLVFLKIEEISKQNEKLKIQALFYDKMYYLFYNIIMKIDYLDFIDDYYTCIQFIRLNHRKFHNHYKKMLVNQNVQNTKDLICLIDEFCSVFDGDFSQLEKLYFSSIYNIDQADSIYTLFLYYKNLSNERLTTKSRIFAMGNLLDEIRILIEQKINLHTLKLIKVIIKNGEKTVNIEDLKKEEPNIKFAEEFNEVRLKNYNIAFKETDDAENSYK